MYQNVKRTCRAIVFPHCTYFFAALSLPLPSSLLKLPFIKMLGTVSVLIAVTCT